MKIDITLPFTEFGFIEITTLVLISVILTFILVTIITSSTYVKQFGKPIKSKDIQNLLIKYMSKGAKFKSGRIWKDILEIEGTGYISSMPGGSVLFKYYIKANEYNGVIFRYTKAHRMIKKIYKNEYDINDYRAEQLNKLL